MKISIKKIVGILLMSAALLSIPSAVLANSGSDDSELVSIAKDNLIGGWDYTVEGAPEGYGKGFMMIVKQQDVYKVQVQIGGTAINGSNVVVKGNRITFTVNVEGETVSVELEAKGSTISGSSTSPANGTMNITGVKTLSPE